MAKDPVNRANGVGDQPQKKKKRVRSIKNQMKSIEKALRKKDIPVEMRQAFELKPGLERETRRD